MGEKKVTKMQIKVDLQCGKCYRKIKKILCSFPQITDQTYDKKQNTVTITVVCCSPEKIKAKICCKGGDIILGIVILPEPKPAPPPKQDPPKQTKQDPPKPTVPAPGCPPVHVVGMCCCPPCYGGYGPCCCPPCYGRYGPCWYVYRPPQMCHDGCGRPVYECQGGNRGYYVSSCGDCFSDENTSGCTVM